MIRFKRTFTDPFPKSREDGYINAGIVPFHGHARFVGPTTVKVEKVHSNSNNDNNDDNDNTSVLNGRHVLIATGSKPMNLSVPGSENITTSDQFLDFGYDRLPDRIVFIGGGYISFEFAHIAARAGAKVTILHRGKRPLEHFDPDLVNRLVERSRDIGIDVRLRSEVKSIDKLSSILSSSPSTTRSNDHSHKLIVHYSSLDNPKHTGNNDQMSKVQTDMVVHGAGREPNIDTLDLNAAGIEYTHRGITVNQYLQSISNPSVYAAGDAAANMGLPLTPVASYDGAVVANNLIKGNTLKSNYTGLPSVVFTIPPLVSIGMQEKEAKEKGLRVKINYQDTSGWASNRRVGETCAAFKVLVDEDTNKILGAHILGPHADEIINIFSIAIRLGLTTKDLNDPILYTYPTNSSDILYML